MRVRARANFLSRVTDERWHQGITPLEEYFVIEVDEENLRVIDDKGEPILYPKAIFEVLDPRLPPGWQFCEHEDGEYHLGPVDTGSRGFYEDLFCSDGDRVAQARALELLRAALGAAMEAGDQEDRRLIQRDLRRLLSTTDQSIEKTLKSAATFLGRWKGARALLWELTVSVKTLKVVLRRDGDPRSNLMVTCFDPLRLRGPVTWEHSELSVSRAPLPDGDEHGFLVVDRNADFEVLCGGVGVHENVKLP